MRCREVLGEEENLRETRHYPRHMRPINSSHAVEVQSNICLLRCLGLGDKDFPVMSFLTQDIVLEEHEPGTGWMSSPMVSAKKRKQLCKNTHRNSDDSGVTEPRDTEDACYWLQ